MKNLELDKHIVSPENSVRELMEVIGRNARGIALVTDDERMLITTLTDGDLRRGLLDGVKIKDAVSALVSNKVSRKMNEPITVSQEMSDDACLQLMDDALVRQLPVIDTKGRVVDLAFRDDLLDRAALRLSYVTEEIVETSSKGEIDAYGVIMAGGFGTRLKPLTDHLPKPMLPINGKPLLEHIIERFERAGIHKLFVSTYYKREVIETHFNDGEEFNVTIDYLHEEEPIGTAGALALIKAVDKPLVMTNGDILTKVDLNAMLDFHNDHEALLTVGVRQYDINVPFGVMNTKGAEVISIDEKPVLDFLVNAGVYVVSEKAHSMIPRGARYDMTDLISDILKSGGSVVAFPIIEYWLDIGKMSDYQKAQEDHS